MAGQPASDLSVSKEKAKKRPTKMKLTSKSPFPKL